MRDVLGTIQADQDAIIRAGSRGRARRRRRARHRQDRRRAAPHRLPALLRPAPRSPPRRRAVRRPAPAVPRLRRRRPAQPRRGGRADLHAAGPRRRRAPQRRSRPTRRWRRLKSSVAMVAGDRAGRPVLRGAADGRAGGRDAWADLWVSADDWAEAFEAPEPGTPHNEARDQVWDALLDDPGRQGRRTTRSRRDLLRRALRGERGPDAALDRAWPLLEPTDLVGDLWSVPAYLRLCAPWLTPDEVRALQRADAQAWTVSDLPLLDAARQRLGDPEASRRRRRREAALAAEREYMDTVVDDLIATDDSELKLMSMLRGDDLRDALVDEAALPDGRPGRARRPVRARRRRRGAGADRRRVADAAAPLPVAELHDRRRPRPGPARVHRVVAGAARAGRARPGRASRR